MDPENIAAIALASISAVVSIATGTFIYIRSSFGDNQTSKLNTSAKFYYPKGGGLICETDVCIDLTNIEEFETQSTKFTNEKGEVKKITTTKKIIPKAPSSVNIDDPKAILKKINSKLELLEKDDESKEQNAEVNNINEFFNDNQNIGLDSVLNNNHLGDKEISETRQLIAYRIIGAYEQLCDQIVSTMKAAAKTVKDEVLVSGGESTTESYENI